MTATISQRSTEGLLRQHIGTAVVACAASLVVHVVLVALVVRFQVRVWMVTVNEPPIDWADPIHLMEVLRDIVTPVQTSARTGEGESGRGMDVAREAVRLGVPADESLTAVPPPSADLIKAMGDSAPPPSAPPKPSAWEPRQEILAIEKKAVADEVAAIPRRRIPKVERISNAPDVVLPVDRRAIEKAMAMARKGGGKDGPGRADVGRSVVGGSPDNTAVVEPAEALAREVGGAAETAPAKPREMKAIEKYLKASVSAYTSVWDSKYGYFKIEIERAGPDMLPVVPKDIVFVQDCSASMTEQKLHFCRNALTNCLTKLGSGDRFNMIAFRDSAEMCFTNWTTNVPEAVEKATRFIGEMKSLGNTDIFAAAKTLMDLKRTAGRPVIAFVVTDGRATVGTTRSTEIIGEFSKLNEGRISVFTMGTVQTANSYLLDLLSHGNRGDSYVETHGRWAISESMPRFVEGIGRPVLSDVRFVFAEGSGCEAYPVLTCNLYQDRPLVLYGRYPKAATNVLFQAVGRAGEGPCDMIFDLNLEKDAREGDKKIRENWARQKIYYLMGQYARKGDAAILDEMRETAKTYRIDIPYERDL